MYACKKCRLFAIDSIGTIWMNESQVSGDYRKIIMFTKGYLAHTWLHTQWCSKNDASHPPVPIHFSSKYRGKYIALIL